MDDYKKELAEVKKELAEVEDEIESLLQRQSKLLDRKDELESILRQSTSKSAEKNDQWEKSDFKWSRELEQKLQSVFKIQQLRPMQLQTMNLTMSGKDCILIMPTGGGKSLCFHLPALLSKGVTLVVSPLVSLMEDQVMALQTYNVEAEMLNASTPKDKLKQIQDAMIDKRAPLKLLYVTPEKLAKSKRFMAKLEKMYQLGRFSRLVIDEVHCCSQWGHDFRPDYKFLGIMKRQFPEVPILGLTATATLNVLEDVKKILNIQSCHLLRASFNRPNLYYEVREKPSEAKALMDEIQKLINSRFPKQSGIIYTFSKKESEDVTAGLQSRGIKAGCYHADLSAQQRSYVHKNWLSNKIHVVVATVAFGMGIDKPDVRFVLHHSLSKSMENLYQESGRAGRDDKKSHCIVYYRFQDVFRQSTMVMTEQTGLRNLYGIMEYCTDISRCRRSMIARHFGEVWDSSQCNKMCDHCDRNYDVEKKDITLYCENVIKIIDNAGHVDQRLTSQKLLDAWQGKGPGTLRVKGAETATSREKLERILAHLLMKNYIREEFHFTPYSTISYLHAGTHANKLRGKKAKVFLEMAVRAKTAVPVDQSVKSKLEKKSSAAVSETLSEKTETVKPKLVIVSDKNSAFTDHVRPSTSSECQEGVESKSVKRSNSYLPKKETSLLLKKRKSAAIFNGESDSEGLDFGSLNECESKKLKSSEGGSHGKSGAVTKKQSKSHIQSDCVSSVSPVLVDSDIEMNGDLDDTNCGKGDNSWSGHTKGSYSLTEEEKTAAVCVIDSDSDFE